MTNKNHNLEFSEEEAKKKINDDLESRYKKISALYFGILKHDDDLHEYSILARYRVRSETRNTEYYLNEKGEIIRHFNL